MFSVSQFAPPMKRAPSAPVPAAVRALLRRWRAQRPLRAGSLLVTIFGDAIAPRGAAVTLGSLIRLAAPFGLTERLVRTSVARLARDGWLAARRSGRRSEYRLTRAGAERFAEATRRIYGQSPGAWDGRWTLLVIPPRSASGRHGLRGPYAPHPRVPQDSPAGSAAAAGPAASPLGGKRSVRALPPPLRARVRARGRLPVGHRAPAAPPAALGTLRRVCPLRG